MTQYFRRYFQSDPGGGGDDDPDAMISFADAFGVDPVTGEKVEPTPAPDPTPDPTPAPDPTPDPTPPGEPGTPASEPATPPDPALKPGETPKEAAERIFAGKYKTPDDLERGYQELQREFSKLKNQQPAPVEEPPPVPLFKGETAEIKTEQDLFTWAQADPEAAAMWAMGEHGRMSPETLNTVMNHWIASSPWQATTAIHAWQAQMLREEFAEQRQLAEQHALGQIRDAGIELAVQEQPLMADYGDELSDFIDKNETLGKLVEAATTPQQLSKALQAAFFVMAGPKLSEQALTAKVAAEVKAAAKAERDAKAAEEASKAVTTTRNTGVPQAPDGDDAYGDAMRDAVLNPGKARVGSK